MTMQDILARFPPGVRYEVDGNSILINGPLDEPACQQQDEERGMGLVAELVANKIAQEFAAHFVANRMQFVAWVVPSLQIGADRATRRPDVAVIPVERIPFETVPIEDPAALPILPAVAVEVASPTDQLIEVMSKIRYYFSSGVESVWLVTPRLQEVAVYSAPRTPVVFGPGDVIENVPVLTGFRLPIDQLFGPIAPWSTPPAAAAPPAP